MKNSKYLYMQLVDARNEIATNRRIIKDLEDRINKLETKPETQPSWAEQENK